MKLSDHGAKAIKAAEETKPQFTEFEKQNIWFNWGEDEKRVVRLVGDFRWGKSHWIGKSKFGKDVDIFENSAFNGDKKLPNKVNCSNWSIGTESADENGGCVLCRIAENANRYLQKNGRNCDEKTKEWLKALQSKCAPKNAYYFVCIDRKDPYVTPGEKGYKIIQMSLELLNAIIDLDKDLEGADICSDDGGIDIVLKREQSLGKGGKGRTKYSATPVFEKTSVKQTPLTDEERSWTRPDLIKIMGKNPESDNLIGKLQQSVKDVWDDSSDSDDSNGESAPF